MCEDWTDPSNCATAGMMGYNMCYSGSVGPQKGKLKMNLYNKLINTKLIYYLIYVT